jgi:hypothetical protein
MSVSGATALPTDCSPSFKSSDYADGNNADAVCTTRAEGCLRIIRSTA